MGRKSGRNGAPAPQSRVSLSESKPEDGSASGLRAEFLAGVVSPDSQYTFQQCYVLSRLCLRALREPRVVGGLWAFALGESYRSGLRENCADVFAISTDGPGASADQDEVARAYGLPGKARRVHSRVHPDAEETELSAAQSCARAADQFCGSDHVYSWDWAQLAGALHRAGARRPREGFAGSALSHRTRHAGRGGSRESQTGPVEIRSQAAQSGAKVS